MAEGGWLMFTLMLSGLMAALMLSMADGWMADG
jgi:hypothetical protein